MVTRRRNRPQCAPFPVQSGAFSLGKMRVECFHIGLVGLLLPIAIVWFARVNAQPGAEAANPDAGFRAFLDGARSE